MTEKELLTKKFILVDMNDAQISTEDRPIIGTQALATCIGVLLYNEEKKVAKIIEELTMFFFTVGADEIETKIQRQHHVDIIWISSNYNPEYKDELSYLEEYLTKEE